MICKDKETLFRRSCLKDRELKHVCRKGREEEVGHQAQGDFVISLGYGHALHQQPQGFSCVGLEGK